MYFLINHNNSINFERETTNFRCSVYPAPKNVTISF